MLWSLLFTSLVPKELVRVTVSIAVVGACSKAVTPTLPIPLSAHAVQTYNAWATYDIPEPSVSVWRADRYCRHFRSSVFLSEVPKELTISRERFRRGNCQKNVISIASDRGATRAAGVEVVSDL